MKPNRNIGVTAICIALLTLAGVGTTMYNAKIVAPQVAESTRRAAIAQNPTRMVYIPAGDFLQGSDDADAEDDVRPRRAVSVPGFYMDKFEVTNADFRRFRAAWRFPKGEGNLPATNVTYADAEAYASWAGKRLPTEAEWEKAARGTDGRRFPWGDEWDKNRTAARYKGTDRVVWEPDGACAGPKVSRVQPVGTRPAGVSPYGCHDMAGNAWEWVQGFYNGNPEQRILRGGAVGYGERASRTFSRSIEGTAAT